MKRNPIADGLKAENLSTNPAYVHQVLGVLQNSEEKNKNTGILEVYSPDKKKAPYYRTWKYWDQYQIIHEKTMSYMIGLGLFEKDPLILDPQKDDTANGYREGRLKLTTVGQELRNLLLDKKKCKIEFHVINTTSTGTANGPDEDDDSSKLDDDEIKGNLKNNTDLYLKIREMFLKSPCFKVFEDFMYENCDSVMTRDELQELYYREMIQVYGNGRGGSIKPKDKRSETSSKSSPAKNNGISILSWCEFFDVIQYDSNNNVIFDLDVNELVKRRIEQTENGKKQIIFTGAPGTGKTFSLLNYVNGKAYEFVQLHPSFDYTDFVEGIRPAPGGDGKNNFVRMDGIFKSYCRRIVKDNVEKLLAIDPSWTLERCFELLSKTYDSEQEKDEQKRLSTEISKLPKYYFIIDEINRADLSKVFGELLFALEDSYRGIEHRFPTQYHNLQTYKIENGVMTVDSNDCFKNGFFIPKNLVILGSMNDIDKSVESIDFALRRRFDWCEIIANNIMKQSLISMNKTTVDSLIKSDVKAAESNLVNRIIKMNDVISTPENGLGREYHIGPAYFNLLDPSENNLMEVFNTRIRPLIKEYLRGRDEDDINKILSLCLSNLIGDLDIEDEDDDDDYDDGGI